jgi:hypothetical protein
VVVLILSKEEQCTETDLLNIQTHEHMLNGFRVEQASGVRRRRLSELIQEEVFVELIEQEEGEDRKTVDDRRNDGIAKSYTSR